MTFHASEWEEIKIFVIKTNSGNGKNHAIEITFCFIKTVAEIMNGSATQWPTFFLPVFLEIVSVICLEFRISQSKEIREREIRLRIRTENKWLRNLFFTRWYFENCKLYRDKWKNVFKRQAFVFLYFIYWLETAILRVIIFGPI